MTAWRRAALAAVLAMAPVAAFAQTKIKIGLTRP